MSGQIRENIVFGLQALGLAIALPCFFLLTHRTAVSALVVMGLVTLALPGVFTLPGKVMRREVLTGIHPASGLLWLFAFCLWALVTVLWTPDKSEAEWALKLFLFFLVSGLFIWSAEQATEVWRRRLEQAFLVGTIFAATILAFEGLTNGLLRDIIPPETNAAKDMIAVSRGASMMISMLFPALAMLLLRMREREGGVDWTVTLRLLVLLTLASTAAVMLEITSNIAALAAGILALFVATMIPRLSLQLVFAGIAAALISAPFAALTLPPVGEISDFGTGPVSWLHRLAAWRLAADEIFSGPLSFLFGNGVQYARWLTVDNPTILIQDVPVELAIMPTHPHNLFLQIWLEFGLAGVLLLLAALWQVRAWVLKQDFPELISAICAWAAVAFVFAAVEVSLWTPYRLVGPVLGLYGFALLFHRKS